MKKLFLLTSISAAAMVFAPGSSYAASKIVCDVPRDIPSDPSTYQSEYDASGPFVTFIVTGKDDQGNDFVYRQAVISDKATCFGSTRSLKDMNCKVTANHQEIPGDAIGRYTLDFNCGTLQGHLLIDGTQGNSGFSCNLTNRNVKRSWTMTNCRLFDSSL